MSYKYDLTKGITKIKNKSFVILASMGLVLGVAGYSITTLGMVTADRVSTPVNVTSYKQVPFTATELTGWTQDRTAPSGGFSSVSFGNRTNVLQMNIDISKQNPVHFYQTEGIQHSLPSGTTSIQADLFVNGSWLTDSSIPVRSGLWGVGYDQNGNVSAYPIIEFTTRGANNFIGWRIWDDNNGGWTNLKDVNYRTNNWNTLNISYNQTTTLFDLYVNGKMVGSSTAPGSVELGAIIFDNYNYGSLGSNYSVDWSNFGYGNLSTINNVAQCKDLGWKNLGNPVEFKNQGQCVRTLVGTDYEKQNHSHHDN